MSTYCFRLAIALAAVTAGAVVPPAHAALPPGVVQRVPEQSAMALPESSGTRAQTTLAQTPPAVPMGQTVSIAAGTGVLLSLPQPAATVISADPAVARVQPASPTSLFLMGVAPGRTTVIATSQSGAAIVQYDVKVTSGTNHSPGGPPGPVPATAIGLPTVTAAAATAAQTAIAQSVNGAQNVRARVAGTDLILSGTVPTAMAAQQAEAIARAFVGDKAGVIDQLMVLSNIQVNVRVRIAEINRQITRQLGFNWQALGSGGDWRFGLRTGAAAASLINPLLPLALPPLAGAASPYQLGAGFTSGPWDVNSIIDALAADQLITILAEPNLTAQSGETASFLAGGEFPIPVAGYVTGGIPTITVDFKQFGVSLSVVPTVMSPTRLNLRIRPEVSQLSNNGAVSVPMGTGTLTIPALTVRRAETTIELGSGQSFAIAGLLQRTTFDVTNALPGIGELPVIGSLFKSNDFQRGDSELVIIVTPYIVRPTSGPTALQAPTDRFKPATDLDRILLGRQLAPASSEHAIDAGFILK
jgi:pilus assembly protein CpaC